MFKILKGTVSKNWKTSAVEKGKESTNRSKQRVNFQQTASFQYSCVAYYNDKAIFVGFSLICLESLGFL